MRDFDPAAFRAHFPIFATGKVHLASCSQGALSVEVLAALDRFVASWRDLGAPWDLWVEEVERARLAFARLIGAQPHAIAVVPDASIGTAMVATALDLTPERDTIVTSDLEFPSMAHVWLAQRPRGARVVHVRHQGGVIPLDAWAAAIDARTRLVSAFHVSYANGARQDLGALARLAHDHGAWLFVDAYQGVGVTPLDVGALGIDFLVAGTLKYLLGTPGLAFLYCREGLAEHLTPALTGWFGRVNPFAFDPLALDFAPDARRFQTGTPAVPAIYTAAAGIDLVMSAGVTAIWHHVQVLAERLTQRLTTAGFALLSPLDADARGPQVSVLADDAHALGAALAERGIVASPRGRAVRLSLHGYNNEADVDRVVDALLDLVRPAARGLGRGGVAVEANDRVGNLTG